MNAKDFTIGVFFGSRSPEHDISIITAQLIISGLKGLGCQIVPVYISKKGQWLIDDSLGELKKFTDPTGNIDGSRGKKYRKYFLDLEESVGKIVFRKKGPFGLFGGRLVIDLAFPAFHGSYGEDGTMQGLFEMLNIPYVGCDVASSAIAMDKVLTKLFYQAEGIPTTRFISFNAKDWQAARPDLLEKIENELDWPVFVKPARLGSSIGMAKIKEKNTAELSDRIEVALHYDDKVLVENAVENLMDVTCCVIGNDDPQASLLQESGFGEDFFSYEDKYLKGGHLGKAQSSIVIPARLDEKSTAEMRELSKKIFKLLGCCGIARIDFLYDAKTKQYFANEINPLPGTLYHHLWKASGVEFGELLLKLLDFAKEKWQGKLRVTTTFESDLLRKAGSAKLQIREK